MTLTTLFALVIYGLTRVTGYVTLENNFVMLKTKDSGTFVGVKEDFENPPRSNYVFRGIPYAKPPIGPLRWKDPSSPDVTLGPKDATKFKSVCPQWDAVENQPIGNADCLYLNIFTPRLHFSVTRHGEELSPYDEDPRHSIRVLPVVVYVHRGGYVSGSGDIWRYERFLEENVVLVTFNYRLGLFGFLSPENSDFELSENVGLLDQIFCLKWIRKNVHRFGGDPNRVTVFGEVSALLVSPLTSDLFQGVIYLPSYASVFNRVKSPHYLFTEFVSSSSCAQAQAVWDCLEIMSVDEVIRGQAVLLRKFPESIGPVVGRNGSEVLSEFNGISGTPSSIGHLNVPVMLGVNSVEGFVPFHNFFKGRVIKSDTEAKEAFKQVLQLRFSNVFNGAAVEDAWSFYIGNFSVQNSEESLSFFRIQMLKLFGDIYVYNVNSELVEGLTQRNASTFYYVFDQNVDKVQDFVKDLHNSSGDYNLQNFPWEEEFFLFNDFEDNFSKTSLLVKIFASFAAYRTPKSALAKEKRWGKWTTVSPGSQDYFHLQGISARMDSKFRQKEAEFWKKTLSMMFPKEEARTVSHSTGEKSVTGWTKDNKASRSNTLSTSSYYVTYIIASWTVGFKLLNFE